ncbi:thiamine diphosphokinase [Parapedobacter sp. DT-150]|uniref:thiamine diphosphokinase n=1 Tax=Parapedobacter sp. DT-150 TaxID=3396162 RepID=UPI003F1A7DFD
MSSHHIVKEDQEPALIIADCGTGPTPYLEQLLEWSPTVITHRICIDQITEWGIKVDVLIANEYVRMPQDHILVLPLATTFIEDAFHYLIGQDRRAANILADDIQPELLLRYADRMNITQLSNGVRVMTVKSGFSKWKPKGESVLVYGVEEVRATQGLKRISNHHYMTEADGLFSISFAESHGLIGEYLAYE